jgi:serine/threonine protein kinase
MANLPFTGSEIAAGTLIDNRYIIQKLLGQGGLGRTYLAFDTRRFSEPCVLKEFAPIGTGASGLEKCRNLFKREAKILHKLEHPQIPRFLACFEGDGRLFLVQEFVDGKTYSDLLRDRQNRGECFSEAEVIDWLQKILPILDYVHEHNIIHRDISPDNIMLPAGENLPVLIDFGVGKQLADLNEGSSSETATFVGKVSLVGKLGYAPREQISIGMCSPSSDLYALGVTGAVLLTGHEPSFLMDQYSLEWKWRSFCDVSDRFAEIIDKMLADRPKYRYQSANEVSSDLDELTQKDEDFTTNFSEENFDVDMSTFYDLADEPSSITPDIYSRLQNTNFNQPQNTNFSQSQNTNFNQSQNTNFNQPQNTNFNQPQNTNFNQPQNTNFNSFFTPQPNQNQSPSSITPDFIQRCQNQLAQYIGPMASFIIEETLADNPDISAYQLVECLSREISDPQAAVEFTRTLFG